MKSTLIIPATFSLILAAAATANAQPSTALAGTAAAADQGDVSQISGELVPVSNHDRYRDSYRTLNIATNPVGLLLGSYGVSASYAIHANFALHADVSYFKPIETEIKGMEASIGVPVYFREVYSGLFLEPGLMFREITEEDGTKTTQYGPQLLVGNHWSWDSGINVAVAAGLGRNLNQNIEGDETFELTEDVIINGYLRFGYAF